MPVNNPAPGIRPPTARDTVGALNPQTIGQGTPDQQRQYITQLRGSGGNHAVTDVNAEADRLERLWGLSNVTGAAGAGAGGGGAGAGGGGPQAPAAPQASQPGGGGGLTNDLMQSYGGSTPAGGNGLNQDLTGFARESLQGGSGRYDIPLVQQAMGLIDSELERGRGRAKASLDELNASRGRTGSTFEAQENRDMELGLEQQRMGYAADLRERLAQTTMGDRKTMADIGTQVGQFGLDQQTVALRAQELQQQAALQGRSLDIEEARLLAQNEQFQANLGQRQAEFAAQMGLENRRFSQEQREFAAQHSESVAQRLQQESQFARSLESDESRFAMQMGLERRALDLQEQGMTMDEAFRRAELEMEGNLRERALELEQQGMNLDEAYRRAALESGERQAGLDRDLSREQMDQTGRLSELDIILRALVGGLDPSQIEGALANMRGGVDKDWGGGGAKNPAPTQTGGGGSIEEILALIRQQGGG